MDVLEGKSSMSKPYALLSDNHFHNWNSFSTINEEGINSRLQIIIDEVCRAKDELILAGGDEMFLAGDIFHTRGSVSPEVINPVVRLFENITKDIKVYAIPGNHDLSSKDSTWLTNAASSLVSAGVVMANESRIINRADYGKGDVVLIPWHSSIEELKAELERYSNDIFGAEGLDVIIHAPVDGVINGLPDHGLTDTYLASLKFNRVFSGHYHDHKDFGNGVYSIGATTHQTWSDVDKKAGFLLVYPDRVKRFASHAPSFVDIFGDMSEEELLVCDRNYVRVRIGKATPLEINDVREAMTERGALGVVIQAVKETSVEERDVEIEAKSVSLEESVADYIAKAFGGSQTLNTLCSDILARAEVTE
jgi:DNA repair exonuclease SbcCD nuclease subunit